MKQKYAIIKENAKGYRKGTKKIKSQILDELERVLNMNRQYLSFLLRNTGRKVVFRESGYVEIDLVHHCGDSPLGQFIYTLTATEINTGWTELCPLRNKAMVWTMEGLKKVKESMPVKIKKIHSDNGSEFINTYIIRFCESNSIAFKRGRATRRVLCLTELINVPLLPCVLRYPSLTSS